MVRFIKYRAKTTAEKRSKEIWEQMLGSPVSTTSTTKYFYDFVASSKSFGGSYLLIHDDGPKALLDVITKPVQQNYIHRKPQSGTT